MENINMAFIGTAAIGFGVASVLWWIILLFSKMVLRRKIRQEMYANLPTSMEEIEHSRNLERAVNEVEMRRRDLKIAELKLELAESEAKVGESLSRIDVLNRNLEVTLLELSAKRARDRQEQDQQILAS